MAEDKLPTNGDVLGQLYFLKCTNKCNYHKDKTKFLSSVVSKVEQVWKMTTIPVKTASV